MPAKQLHLIQLTGDTFGKACAAALKEAKRTNPQLSWEEIADIIERQRKAWFPDRASAAEKKGELFSAIVSACGMKEPDMTKDAQRLAAVSLAQIKNATPNVTPEELTRRAQAYRRKYRDASCTPRALALHWAEFPAGPIEAKKAANPYDEPEGWRERLPAVFKQNNWSEDKLPEYISGRWLALPLMLRIELLKINK